ncbi:MAG: DUF5979 domain-containing protein [Schaalia odontolytica]|nr:DUF5979 domain-containing protein [Schaalia odontolytica]MDU5761952.1 DUF5979 domain-containing protein [Schaalia odontolytica]
MTMFRAKWARVAASASALVLAATGIGVFGVFSAAPAEAAVNPNIKVAIKPLVLSDQDGVEIPGAGAQVEDPVRMYVEWDASDANPQPGDSFTVGLPTTGAALPDITHYYRFREVGRSDPLMFDGLQVGECVTAADVMTCTFNQAVAAQSNVKGKMNQMLMAQKETPLTKLPFNANGVETQVPNPNDEPIVERLWTEKNVGKYANSLKRDSTQINWHITGSGRRLSERSGMPAGTYANKVVFNDVLGADGQTLLPDDSTWYVRVDPKSAPNQYPTVARVGQPGINTTYGNYTLERTISADGKSATVTFTRTDGDFDPAINYEIVYSSKIVGNVIPEKQYTNSATLVGDTEGPITSAISYRDPITYTIEMKPGYGAFGVKKYVLGAQVGADAGQIPATTAVTVNVNYELPAGWDPALHPEWTAPEGGANPYTMKVPVEQGVAGVAFPKGTKVTLTESLDSAQLPAALRWQGEPSFSIGSTNAVNEVSFTIAENNVSSVSLTNTAAPAPGKIAVTKKVVGDIPAGKTFAFDYVCDDAAKTSGSITDVVAGQAKESGEIPAGATCTVTERDASVDGNTLVTSTIDPVTVKAGEVAALEVTNTYAPKVGKISVTKEVVGDIPAGKTFSFDYVCNDPAKTSGSILNVAAGETKESGDIPDGAECLVTEREAEAAVDGFILECSAVDPVPVKAGEVAAVLMTNTYTPAPGNIAVTKKVVGDIPADKTFSFDYVCDDPAKTSGSITDVAAGDTKVSRDIPAGATCTVTEKDASVDGFTLQTSAIDPVVIKAGEVATLEVTNTYTPVPSPTPTPSETPGGNGGGDRPSLARTGADVLGGSLATLTLLGVGGGLLALRRARR